MTGHRQNKINSWSGVISGPGLLSLALILSCVFLHAMDVFVIATILPSVVADIDGVAFYAWPSAFYIMTSIIGAASGGVLGLNIGLRRALTVAASVYLIGSIICASAPAMGVFLLGRSAQGLGGGLMVALAYTMIRQLFLKNDRARVFALMSMIWGFGALIGPIIAGIFAQMGYWRAIYWLTAPVFVIILFLSRQVLRDASVPKINGKLPWERLLILGLAIMCVTFSGQTDHLVLRLTLILGALLGVAVTIWLDKFSTNPMLPSYPASLNWSVGAGYWVFFLLSLSFAPLSIFLPLFAQKLHGVPPSLAGYVSAALSLGWSAAAFAVVNTSTSVQRILMISGPICLLLGIFGQSLFIVKGPVEILVTFVFFTGLGIGQCHAHISNYIMSNSKSGEEALTAGGIPTVQSIGIAFGAAMAGVLSNIAGISNGLTTKTLIEVTDWIYGFAIIPASLSILVALRLVWLIQKSTSLTRS